MPSNRKSAPTPTKQGLNTSRSPLRPLALRRPTVSCPNVSTQPPASTTLRGQSSHPAIEIPANLMKTLTKTFLNRHTFGVFAFSTHCPLAADLHRFPFWPGSPKPKGNGGPAVPKPTGDGGYSTHPGGRHSRDTLKTLAENFSTRHTPAIFSSRHSPLVTCQSPLLSRR